MKRSLVRTVCAALAVASALTACGKQGEGDRCDPRNGNADCESSLICTQGLASVGDEPNTGLCCPPEGEQNIPACFPESFPIDGSAPGDDDAGPEVDASETGAPEAGPDSSSADTGVDTSTAPPDSGPVPNDAAPDVSGDAATD